MNGFQNFILSLTYEEKLLFVTSTIQYWEIQEAAVKISYVLLIQNAEGSEMKVH